MDLRYQGVQPCIESKTIASLLLPEVSITYPIREEAHHWQWLKLFVQKEKQKSVPSRATLFFVYDAALQG
jgi:hypothetical protein